MYMIYQKRLPKKYLNCNNPQDDVKEFLERIYSLCSLYMEADTISGPPHQEDGCRGLDRMVNDLVHGDW